MTLVAQDDWMVLEDALYQLVSIAVQPGGVLAVQPNQDGSTGINLIERIAPPEQNLFPSIGLMCATFDERITAANSHDLVGTFDLVIAVRRKQDDTVPDTGAAALADLRNYQNDGSGNGLSPLLRTNSTLFGLCQWSQITRMERYPLQNEASSASMIATAIYTFETHSRVRIS